MATSAQKDALVALYAGYFDRAPDPAGLQFWINQIDNGRAMNTIAADFAASAEATTLYPYLTAPDVASSATFITSVYQNLFNRAPDAEGLKFWSDVLTAKTVSVADMIQAIINGAKDAPTATPPTFDKATLNNKVEAGLDFAVDAGNTAGFTFDAAAKVAATAAIAGVTNDPATVTAAKAQTDAFLTGSATVGQTLTLTTGSDVLNGTANDDTFNAVVNATTPAQSTLTGADIIKGGTGTDSLTVIADGAAAVTVPLFNVSGVENFFFRDVDATAGTTADFATIAGEVQAWNDRSVGGTVTLSNLGTGTTVGVKGDGVNNISATNFSMATATDAVNILVDGGVKGGAAVTNTSNGATGATITSSGAANVIGAVQLSAGATVTASAVNANTDLTTGNITGHKADATMTVTGAGKASLGTLEAAVDTVNASAHTGGLTLVLDAEADTKVTAGSGADSITTGAVLTTGSVDAGAGTDTVTVANSADLATAALGAKYTNFETLGVLNGVSVDLDNIAGITAVAMTDGASNLTELKDLSAVQAGAVTIKAGDGAAIIGVKGAATVGQIDTVKMTFDDGDKTLNEDINATASTFTLASIENIEVTAVDQVDIVQSNVASGDLTSVKLMGAGDVSFTTGNMDQANFNLDASALTGKATLDATGFVTNGVAIKGGTKADIISGSSQADNITLGAGADTLKTLVGGDTITDFTFGQGGDILDLSGAGNAAYAVGDFIADADGTLKVINDGTTAAQVWNDGAVLALKTATAASYDSKAEIATLFGAGAEFEAATIGDAATLMIAAADTGKVYVYNLKESGVNTSFADAADTVTLVGTFDSVSAAQLDGALGANFIA